MTIGYSHKFQYVCHPLHYTPTSLSQPPRKTPRRTVDVVCGMHRAALRNEAISSHYEPLGSFAPADLAIIPSRPIAHVADPAIYRRLGNLPPTLGYQQEYVL